jgi:hypothetical protein
MTKSVFSPRSAQELDAAGIPRPDGTPLGDVAHVLAVYQESDADTIILRATSNVYGRGEVTGMSMGDLRELFVLATLGARVRAAYAEVEEQFFGDQE